MPITLSPARLAAREAAIIEHMESENVQEWDRTMRTFSRARYELPDGTIHDGTDDVMRYWIEGRSLIPDQRNKLIELTHLDDYNSQIEFWLRGTPVSNGTPFETGVPFEIRLFAVFTFDGDDRMTNERVYVQAPTADQVAGRVTPDGHTVT